MTFNRTCNVTDPSPRFSTWLTWCLLTILTLTLPSFVSAQNTDRKKFVIGSFQSRYSNSVNNDQAAGLSEMLSVELSQSRDIIVVDRSAMNSIITEFSLAHQGATGKKNTEPVNDIGRPDFLLTARYYDKENTGIIAAKIINPDNDFILESKRIEVDPKNLEQTVEKLKDFAEQSTQRQPKLMPEYLIAVGGFEDLSASDAYLYYGDEIAEFISEKFMANPSTGVLARSQMMPLLREQRLKEIAIIRAGQRMNPLPSASLLISGTYEVTIGAPHPITLELKLESPGIHVKKITINAQSLEDCLIQAERNLNDILGFGKNKTSRDTKIKSQAALKEGLFLTGINLEKLDTNNFNINTLPIGFNFKNGHYQLSTPKSQIAVNLRNAVEQFKKALRLDPYNPEAMLLLGLCLQRKEFNLPAEGAVYLERVILGAAQMRYKKIAAHYLPKNIKTKFIQYPLEQGMRPEVLSHLHDGMKLGEISFSGLEREYKGVLHKSFPPRITSNKIFNQQSLNKKEKKIPLQKVSALKRLKTLHEAIDRFESALFLDSRNYKAMLLLAYCLRDPAIGDFNRADQLCRCVLELSKQEDYIFVAADFLDIVEQISFSPVFDRELNGSGYHYSIITRKLQKSKKKQQDDLDSKSGENLKTIYLQAILAQCLRYEEHKSAIKNKNPFSHFAELSKSENSEDKFNTLDRRDILSEVWKKYPKTAPHLSLIGDMSNHEIQLELAEAIQQIDNFENDLTNPADFNKKLAKKFNEMLAGFPDESAVRIIGAYLREVQLASLISAHDYYQNGWIIKAAEELTRLLNKDTECTLRGSDTPVTVADLAKLPNLKDPKALRKALIANEFLSSSGVMTDKWYNSFSCYTHRERKELQPFSRQLDTLCRHQRKKVSMAIMRRDGKSSLVQHYELFTGDQLQKWIMVLDNCGENSYQRYTPRYIHCPKVKTRLGTQPLPSQVATMSESAQNDSLFSFPTTDNQLQSMVEKITLDSYPNFGLTGVLTHINMDDSAQPESPLPVRSIMLQGPNYNLTQGFMAGAISSSGTCMVLGDPVAPVAFKNYPRKLLAGAAYVSCYGDDGKWSSRTTLNGDKPQNWQDEKDLFGAALAMSGDHILVGVPSDDDEGSVGRETFKGVAVDADTIMEKLFQLGYLDAGNKITDKVRGVKYLSDLQATITREFPEYTDSVPWKIAKILHEMPGLKSCGTAYLFKREGGDWLRKQKLSAFDADVNNTFGIQVAIDGDFAMVGALGSYSSATHQASGGGVYLFQLRAGQFQFVEKLIEGSVDTLSMSGDLAVVGLKQRRGLTLMRREVLVFRRNGDKWLQEANLRPLDYKDKGDSFARFGITAVVKGRYIAVGNPWDDLDNRANGRAGSVYIFERFDEQWIERQKLVAQPRGREFGHSLALAADHLLVGGRNNKGFAVLYERNDNFWTQKNFYSQADTDSNDKFAEVVHLMDNYGIITDSYKHGATNYFGSLYFVPINGPAW